MESLNGHEAGNGGYSQGDTCRCDGSSPTRRGKDTSVVWILRIIPKRIFAPIHQLRKEFFLCLVTS
jgi:hypothetical protein